MAGLLNGLLVYDVNACEFLGGTTMKSSLKSILICLTLGINLAVLSEVYAGSETMLKLLEVLRNNGTIDEQAYKLLVAAALEEENDRSPGTAQNQIQAGNQTATMVENSRDKGSTASVEYEGSGLRIKSASGAFESRLGGYFQVDAAKYNETNIPMGDGGEVRRARLGWRGLIGDSWLFRTSLDFADGADIKSTYIDYRPTSNSSIRFGSFKEPFNLEELSSARYITFMERAMMNTFAPGRAIGLGYNNEGSHHSFKIGLYTGESEDESDAGWAATGRMTYAPIVERRNVLHFGLATSYRDLKEGNVVRFRSRPESHVTDVRLIDTGDIADGKTLSRVGLEAAAVRGPISFQGEYIITDLERNSSPGVVFDGWYAYATWTLTGESREYDAGNGRFRGLKPRKPLGGDGSGAWELGLRYSNADLNDQDIIGGEEDNITLALNWYPNRNVRFSVNYINVLDVDRPGSETDGEDPDIVQMRGQVQF